MNSPSAGATQFVADWYVVYDTSARRCAAVPTNNFVQIGWAQSSFADPSAPRVFEHDTVRRGVAVLRPGPDHPGHDGELRHHELGNTWVAWLWWNNAWNHSASPTMPWTSAPNIAQENEVYNGSGPAAGPSVAVHTKTATEVDRNGVWVSWDRSINGRCQQRSDQREPGPAVLCVMAALAHLDRVE